MRPRSYLFVPASWPERIDKALGAGADEVIVDLEDAVGPGDKDAARAALVAWLANAARSVVVRINAADSAHFAADLRACASPRVRAVMLPKAGLAGDLDALRAALPAKPMIALIETAEGIDRAREIARTPGVERLAFGAIDFQLDLGIEGDGIELLAFRSQLVLASRLAKLPPPIDGVTVAIDDAAAIERDTLAARRLGFGAKLCIHPRQVAAVHRALAPSEAEVAWARRVLDAAAAARGAAFSLDGKMIDKPVIGRARGVVARDGG